MSTVLPQYPFDPTGTAATNKVVETQQIQSRGMFDHYYIIPRSGPFYAESVRLRLYPAGANVNNPAGGQALEEGLHYNFGYHFAHASHTIGLPVYGAITFYDRNLAGQLRMEYQTIGGEWVLDDQKYSELLLNVAFNPRIGTWEQVVELPHQFPVVNHDFNIDDFVGMSEVVDELGDIEQAILMKNAGGLADHIADQSNPHNVTKAQVGLGLVDNFPTATVGEATTATANNRFMTPLRVKQLVDATVQANLNAHQADMNNPHQTTKAQVGLGNVQNYAVSTQAEAEAGSSNARYMTPLRVREAIEAIVGVKIDAHIADKNNPHQTTKAHVGLGNVPNIGVATDSAALSGVDDSGIITPRLLALVLSNTVGSGVSDHVNNFNNPHGVTKAQVGLGNVQNYPVATEAEARDGTVNDRYMTPLAVRYAINEMVGESTNAHASDFNNPHATTKVQVGLGSVQNYPVADQTEARAAIATDRYMTPLAVRYAIEELVGGSSTEHFTDYLNPHRVTAAQVGTYSEQEIDDLLADKIGLTDTASNSSRVYGMTQADLVAWLATQTAGNALEFEGRTYAEAKADILAGKAADTEKFDGKTYAQVKADMASAVDGSSIQWDVPPMPGLLDDLGNEVDAPLHWIKLGSFKNTPEDLTADLTLMITGGRDDDAQGDFKHQTVLVEIGATYDRIDGVGPFLMVHKGSMVKHLTPGLNPIEIGILPVGTEADAVMEVWLRSEGPRNRLTITELSYKKFVAEVYPVWDEVADLITVEPTGMIYPEVVLDGSAQIEALETFVARRDNPMQVTKAQVGLGSVNNYGTASNAQAITGTAANLYMTPAATTAKVENDIGLLCDGLITVIDDALVNLFA